MAVLGRSHGIFGHYFLKSLNSWPGKKAVLCYSSSSSSSSEQFRFSYFAQARQKVDYRQLFSQLAHLNPLPEAAVVLVNPDFYKDMTKNSETITHQSHQFPVESSSSSSPPFHVLFAVVDNVPSPSAAYPQSKAVSVLCGRLKEMLPDMMEPNSAYDPEAIGTIDFVTGDSRMTLPLARTTFVNGQSSTLIAAQIQNQGSSFVVNKWLLKNHQRVFLSSSSSKNTNLDLWAPLVPITHSRVVTNSFGNIVKAVEVDGGSEPASMELEKAVEVAASNRFPSGVPPQSWGIWAVVTPKSCGGEATDLAPFSLTEPVSPHLLMTASQHIEQLCKFGGRLYRILSGGGGWGNKKGLLSLDPQQFHPAAEDNDDDKMLDVGTFEIAPPGSRIQFFATVSESKPDLSDPHGFAVGVPDCAEAVNETNPVEEDSGRLSVGHFGALASHGIFVDGPIKTKLDVPGSRLYVKSWPP